MGIPNLSSHVLLAKQRLFINNTPLNHFQSKLQCDNTMYLNNLFLSKLIENNNHYINYSTKLYYRKVHAIGPADTSRSRYCHTMS